MGDEKNSKTQNDRFLCNQYLSNKYSRHLTFLEIRYFDFT